MYNLVNFVFNKNIHFKSMCCMPTAPFIAHHRVLKYLPEVVVQVCGLVVFSGQYASKFMPVGDEHEDALQESKERVSTKV